MIITSDPIEEENGPRPFRALFRSSIENEVKREQYLRSDGDPHHSSGLAIKARAARGGGVWRFVSSQSLQCILQVPVPVQ